MSGTRILAIETATAACSAALYVDGEIEERHALEPRQHASLILPMLESLLVSAGLRLGQLDAVAYGQGPGAFTGVRIAASAAQGIAFAADLPVIAVSTLAALAGAAMRDSGETQAMVALDARMGEVYWGLYLKDDGGLPVARVPDTVAGPAEVSIPAGEHWVAAGSGWGAYAEVLQRRAGERVACLLPDLEPRAFDVARIAAARYDRGEVGRATDAVPVYLRDQVVRTPGS